MKTEETGIWNARQTAVQVLYAVEEEGAFSNLALKKALWEQKQLTQRDKNLVTALVYGTEKYKIYIDHLIGRVSNRKKNRISPWTLAILRVGIFQILFLDKVPSFAAVHESVELVKATEEHKAAGFVNGVLRNVTRSKDDWDDSGMPDHVRCSVPKKVYDFVASFYGNQWARDFFQASLKEAPLTIRVNTKRADADSLKVELAHEGVDAKTCKYASNCLSTKGLQQIPLMNSHRNGKFIIQDEGAMLSVEILGVEKNQRILDMCAAPGGKSTHMAQITGDGGQVVARDVHEHKLALIEENAERMGLSNILIQCKDAIIPPEEGEKCGYDRVLLDAPCSGLGILRRKPDIKYHLTKEKFHALVQMQKVMIRNGFDALKPGGVFVYTTCTVNPRENAQVVDYLLRERSDAQLDTAGIPEHLGHLVGEDGYIQLWPQIHGTDGFFMARIVKKEEL